MPRWERVADAEARDLLARAERDLRGGDATASVHACCDAFVRLIALRPELLQANIPGDHLIHHRQFPRLGADLYDVDGRPAIRFERQRFSTGDAITYFEFTIDTALSEQL
ncbi:MAG: hypothetical protein FJZ92_02565 [Chloroflexi bacterium]|nr:hypothetical protein [Chloroflexota bacterium]